MSGASRRAKWLGGLGCSVVVLCAALAPIVAGIVRSDPDEPPTPFSAELWRAYDPCYGYSDLRDPARRSMIDDLSARLLTPGTSRADVFALLGEPCSRGRDEVQYGLGMRRDFGGRRMYWLRIQFDADGRVVQTRAFGTPE